MAIPSRNNVMFSVEDFESCNAHNLHKVVTEENIRLKQQKFLEEKKETGYRLKIIV